MIGLFKDDMFLRFVHSSASCEITTDSGDVMHVSPVYSGWQNPPYSFRSITNDPIPDGFIATSSTVVKRGDDYFYEHQLLDNLPQVKLDLAARIDREAEACRLKFITSGDGQVMEYQQAAQEARALIDAVSNDAEVNEDDYPMLQASLLAGVDGETLEEVAETVLTMYQLWQVVGSRIRSLRLKAKREIAEAEVYAAAMAAANVVWPTDASDIIS